MEADNDAGAVSTYVIVMILSGGYLRWEPITICLRLLDLAWLVLAFLVQPNTRRVVHDTLIPHVPPGGLTPDRVFLVIVGTTIAPWQLVFQQSCVADKRLRFKNLKWTRLDTFLGAEPGKGVRPRPGATVPCARRSRNGVSVQERGQTPTGLP
jgi:Mn2+/Fe2+ NRAMP family transporter